MTEISDIQRWLRYLDSSYNLELFLFSPLKRYQKNDVIMLKTIRHNFT